MAEREDRSWILAHLRGERTAEEIAAALGIEPEEVERRRRIYLDEKRSQAEGSIRMPGTRTGRVLRDRWGVAHVEASTLADGFFALGFAMGQDRLWQLDYLRRRAQGRLADLFGRRSLNSDRMLRTVGLGAAAERAVERLDGEEEMVLAALADGINAALERTAGNWPIEFELLEYEPEPWRPADSIALWRWRWWMLTGRLDLIVLEEACKRFLPEDLRAAFLATEACQETIVPGDGEGNASGHDVGEGSNNWVVGGSRTVDGKPILATDPHNAIDHPSQWYEAQLTVPGIDAIGAFYLGTPGIYLGHTRRTAWGVTNHTASGRDLYVERGDGGGGRYFEGGEWREFEVERQEIPVRGEAADLLEIRRTVRGPVVDEFITSIDAADPPRSLRWVGNELTAGFAPMLALMRSSSLDDLLQALRGWPFPNLNFLFADADGRIGYHAVGTVPRREPFWRGFRPAGEAEHDWQGAWEFDELPLLIDPERDWVATANNPPLPGAGAYISTGNWADGYRFRRIRERIEAHAQLDMAGVAAIQADVRHARACDLAAPLAKRMRQSDREGVRALAERLEEWDGSYGVDEIGPILFEAFWQRWLERVARARFPEHLVNLVAGRAGSLARRLLLGEELEWFAPADRVRDELMDTIHQAVEWFYQKLGEKVEEWRWGEVHRVRFPHPLGAQSPELKALFSPGPFPTSGGTGTVRAAGFSTAEPFRVTGASTYRLVVDMAHPESAWSTTTGGSSGHPTSPHYADQTALWLEDRYHPLLMDVAEEDVEAILELCPDR